MASSARWLVALVPVVLIVACNTVDPDQCWPNTTGGFGGAGTIPIGGAVSSGDFPTPAHHPLTSSDLPNPCLEPGSACEEKCLTDYESRAVGCAGFADAVQRKACQDDAYAKYRGCRAACVAPADCLEACKEKCDKAWEKCRDDCPKGNGNCLSECTNTYSKCLKDCDKRCK
jgi:hypothetical protein